MSSMNRVVHGWCWSSSSLVEFVTLYLFVITGEVSIGASAQGHVND